MEISFSTKKLAKQCNSEKKLRGDFGPRTASIIQQRLRELQDATTLEVIRTLPGPNCHVLTANFKGMLAVSLVYPDRLVFKPNHDPLPEKEDGGLDWKMVTKITVVGIGDYH